MQNLLSGIGFIFLVGFVPYAIAVIMPSWRTLAICTLLIGGGFTYLWIDQWIAEQSPDYHEGAGGAVGIAIVAIATLGFGVGVAVRAASLALAWARWRRTSIVLNLAGFAAVIGVFVVPYLWSAWLLRPVAAECASARFSLQVANAHLRVPASPLFNVYLGPTSASEAYYGWSTPSLRALCGLTDTGRRTLRATNIWLDIGSNQALRQMTCADAERVLGAGACEAFVRIKSGRVNETDYPIGAYVFAPDEVRLGEFGGRRSTYEDAVNRANTALYPEFFRSERLLADGTPVTYACFKSNVGYSCRAGFPWHDGAYLNYTFYAAADEVIAKGDRVDARVRAVFDAMRAAP